MSIVYKVYGDPADLGCNAGGATYLTVRTSTVPTSGVSTFNLAVGQRFASPTYTIYQGFLQFDLSSVPAGGTSYLDIGCQTAATLGGDTLEVHQATASTNKIAGASIAGLTLLGSIATPTTTGRKQITMTADPTRSATSYLLLSSGRENTATAPTGVEQATYFFADNTGTTNDPFLQLTAGTAWDFVGAGTSVEATATSHILTEPAGVAAGDLLVACIGSRIASTTSITLPSGWTRVSEQKTSNTAATTSATASGMMAYIVRGASPPSYTFTHPVAPNVALGRVVAYRNVHQTTPFDVGGSQTSVSGTGAPLAAGLTTTADDDLIVGMCVGGQEGTWDAYNAGLVMASSSSSSSVLDPIWGQFLERADVQTTTGADMSLAVFDGVMQTAGATTGINAVTPATALHVNIAGAFKLAPPAPTGDTWNEDQDETLSAAETVDMLLARSGPIAETAAVAETVAGLLDATRIVAETAAAAETLAATLVTDKAVAETAAAVDTLTGGLAFDVIVAETAAAADTITKTISFTGVVAETVSAADTVGGLLVRIGAIAETAAAAETTDASVVAAPGVFDHTVAENVSAADTLAGALVTQKAIAETVTAAETLTGSLAFDVTVAETAAAAETITKAVSYTGAVAETASAADTVGGLMVRVGAVAESTSAVDTPAGLLTLTAAIAETAAAAETIIPIVVPAGGTLYEETVLETLAALDEVSADVIRASVGGGIGHGGAGKRRRHLFIYETTSANDDDEDEEPKPVRKLRLKKAEVEEKIEDAIAWIEAGSPRPLSQQALVAEVSAVLDIAALLEADRRRVERTIYRYVAALLAAEEEEEGVAMLLLAA